MRLLRLLVMFSVLATPLAWAGYAPVYAEENDTETFHIMLPLTTDSAAELAQLRTGGKVLSVEEEQRNSYTLYLVKVLHDNGRVRTYRFDRDTGQTMRNR
ncbi:hypothetical protein MPL1_10833 [Methylophaga lonarensis MPL]|uniref:PepSY domain-containing protein n=1 Tax=Methylophaga lonarensis MPL TaxID=1286106 RepID=M7NYP5_9GAMM|nr:hypothetical protein [Methylophaga lonarensis]EMR12321.1 hypothetical protein MPL1_10833 [Methylophaga lonarensis MPL]